jgi:hypothetical protein
MKRKKRSREIEMLFKEHPGNNKERTKIKN